MLQFLFLLIIGTESAPPPDYQDIFVNEWGVVVFSAMGTTVAGAPDRNGNLIYGREPFGPISVDAPVIWLHGAFLESATLTVKANQGWLTAIYPEPDTTDAEARPTTASWEISAPPPIPFQHRPEFEEPSDIPFAWAMDFWREVPGRDLFSANNGEYMGNFLYYEAGLPFWEAPDGIYDPKTLAGYYAPEGLLITTGNIPSVQRIQLVQLPDGTGIPPASEQPLPDSIICKIVYGWAGGNLLAEEIVALWKTWQPFFTVPGADDECTIDMPYSDVLIADRRGQGQQWILFPLPWDVAEGISSIHLEVHDSVQRNITYNRLFLGLVRVY
jgi:hypothetical protein